MTRASRILLIGSGAMLSTLAIAWVVLSVGLTSYDRRTRNRIMEQVALEVPLGADSRTMEEFMRKYTVTYSVDERFDNLYAGVFQQSWFDRILGQRTVILRLRFDSNRRFTDAEVLVTYQTL